MKTNASLDAALLMLANSYHVEPLPEAALPIIVVLPAKAAKEKKVKGKKASKDVAPKTLASAAVLPINMPIIGSLSAEQFLIALRGVGMRSAEDTNLVTGEVSIRTFHDATFDREDTIRAIHAFCGYDAAGNFGAQDTAARAQAQRDLRGGVIPGAAHRRGGAMVSPSIQGYVAGNPDHNAKRKADLEGRERLSVNEYLRHLKNASIATFVAPIGEAPPAVMAGLEQERLSVIREDLAKL